MSIRDLIKAGRVDLAEGLYLAALNLIDVTEDETSIRDIDEAEDRLFYITNRCTAASANHRARERDYAKRRKEGSLLSLRDLTPID